MPFKGKILVTDGRSLAALAIVRSFGEKGFEVHCGDCCKYNLSSFSKYVQKKIIYPSAEKSESEFINFIISLTKIECYDMIIPVRDQTTLLLSKYQSSVLKYCRLYLPDYNIIKKFRDKGQTIKLAQKMGVPVPKTLYPEDISIDRIKKEIEFPVLIRARISSGSRGIKKVNSLSEFDLAYNDIKMEYGEPIIQEYINKSGYSTACILLDEYRALIASFSYERVKEYPISGGPTVVGISSNDLLVKHYSSEFLKNVEWKGVAEIEYILDKNGNPFLLEVNPRFWMPLNLSIRSGVDFPFLLYTLAMGNKVDQISSYNVGVKYRWVLPNEILWFLSSPNKIQAFKEFMNFSERNACYGILSKDDPGAIIGFLFQCIYFLFDPAKRKIIFRRGW